MAKIKIFEFEFDTRETMWEIIQKRRKFEEKYGSKAASDLQLALTYLVSAEIEGEDYEKREGR